MTTLASVAHRTVEVDGMEIFYREAGPPDGPVVLLPHGYPCSSFQFRGYMACRTTVRSSGCAWRWPLPNGSPR